MKRLPKKFEGEAIKQAWSVLLSAFYIMIITFAIVEYFPRIVLFAYNHLHNFVIYIDKIEWLI